MKKYLELVDGNSSKFWEIEQQDNQLTIRYGKIGSSGQTIEKAFSDAQAAQKEFDKLLREKTKKGYAEVAAGGASKASGGALSAQDFKTISEAEAKKRFNLSEYINGLYRDESQYLLYEGDVVFEGNLDTQALCQPEGGQEYNGIIVTGNMAVAGTLYQPEGDFGETLLVLGNLKAKNLDKGGAEFYIKGNLEVEQTIYGYYNHGSLVVEGNTTATLIFANDQYFEFKGDVQGIVIDAGQVVGTEADYTRDELDLVLLPELLTSDGRLNGGKSYEYSQQGQHWVQKKFQPEPPKPKPTFKAPSYKVISWEEVEARFNPVFEMPFGDFADELSEIRLYEADAGGNVHFPGDFVLEGWESSGKDFNAVIAGNLVVDGNLRLGAENIGTFVLVMGNVEAKAITLSGTVSLDVRGSAKVQHGILGMYGDDGGYLSISGDVTTPVVLNTLYFNMALSGKVKAVTIDTSYGDLDADFDDDDVENALVKAVLEPEGGMDEGKVAKYLLEGKPVLKKGAKSARVLVQEELERLSKSGQPTEELDLSDKKLGAFPKLLTTLSTLKKLNLSYNAIKALPEEIGKMVKLEELYLEECELEELPEEIGKLQALRVLDVSHNDGLVLPESIGNLKSLKVLKHDYNQGFELPESFGELKGLEELSLYQNSNAKPLEFPQVLTELSGLRKLDIGSNSFKSLPESFLKLKNLEELRLDASLCYLDSLPDLSQLKKLRVLHADGLVSYTTRPRPKQSLLKSFFEIARLEELYIDRHNEENDSFDNEDFQQLLQNLSHNPEREAEIKKLFRYYKVNTRWTGISRPDLKPEYLYGISKLKKLRVLDLSFNGLERLPEEIYGMGTLQEINLQYNHLPKAERERVAQAFPNTKIDFRNNSPKNKADEPAETEARRKMVELVRKANEKRHSPPYLEALKLYDQALKMFDSGEVADDYNFIYIHYSKMWIYGQLAYRPNNLSEADIRRYQDLGLAEAKLCLELVPTNALVWHYTDEGQFHKETIRYASNTVAWYLYEHAQPSDTSGLEAALEAIERGVAFADEPRHYYLHDTKVRILLKMGRTDEAYRIVQRILQAEPDFGDFKDLKKDKGYKKWLSQQG